MRDSIKIRGLVTVRVLDGDGEVKRGAPGFWRKLCGMRGRRMEYRHHNIVTRQGDALIADALLLSPTRAKIGSGSGFIQIGTGWTGNNTKQNTRCNAAAGNITALESGLPILKGAWGSAGDTTVIYRATFTAGSLDGVIINEACLLNGNGTEADCLAYAQITPSATVTASDTLQVVWEITICGE